MTLTLGHLVAARLQPMLVCRKCRRTVIGGTLALVRLHGADCDLLAYLRALRCSTCRVPPDVALVWDDDGAATRATSINHVRWHLWVQGD